MLEFPKICRLCTKDLNIIFTLNSVDTENISLLNKLEAFAPSTFNPNDNLPNTVCETCHEKLIQSYEFQKVVIKSYKILSYFSFYLQNESTECIKTESLENQDEDLTIIEELKKIIDNYSVNKEENNFSDGHFEDDLNQDDIKLENDICLEPHISLTTEEVNKPIIQKKRGRPKKIENLHKNREKLFESSDDEIEIVTVKKRKNKKKITRIGAVQSENDPTEYTYQLPEDPNVKIIYISNPQEKFFFCKTCNKQYCDFSSLRKHFVLHTNVKIYKCDLCDYQTYRKSHLNIHKNCHLKIRPEICAECGKSFQSKDRLQRHMYSHTKRYICEICGKNFSYSALLRKHVTHVHTNDRNFVCSICGFAAKSQEYLDRHMIKHDTDDSHKIECTICKKLLKTRDTLRIHMKRHNEDRKFECSLCDKKYVVKSQLDIHFRLHTGFKPFVCNYCGKQFRKVDPYKNHVRIHTNERPFVCEYCNKGFTQKVSLQVHLRLHTGARPFSCSICGKSFIQSSVHKMHMKKNHPEQEFKS